MGNQDNCWFRLQRILNEGLCIFLNGDDINHVSRYLYPLWDRLDGQYWAEWAHRVEQLVYQVVAGPSGFGLQCYPCAGSIIQPKLVASWLAHLGRYMNIYMPGNLERKDPPVFIPCLRPFNLIDFRSRGSFLDPVLKLERFAKSHISIYVLGLYLHGSISTLDYVEGSSDLDALVVLKKTTICDAQKLLLLRRNLLHTFRWFYQVDCDQHHGYAVLSELDLQFHSQTLFPQVLFSYLTPLTGTCGLTIRTSHDENDLTTPCRETVKYIRHMTAPSKSCLGWFELKVLLQSVLLLPTLFLQARGRFVYKRDSFALARGYFSDAAWSIVDKASQIRAIGPNPAAPLLDNFLVELPNPWSTRLLYHRLCNQVPRQVTTILGDNWKLEANRLVDEIESRLRYGCQSAEPA